MLLAANRQSLQVRVLKGYTASSTHGGSFALNGLCYFGGQHPPLGRAESAREGRKTVL
jgi:hypothetical protein